MLKKIAVTLAIFIPVASALAAPVTPAGLLGTWRSDDTSGGSDKGTMVLKKGGEVDMQPDGFPASIGHYTVHTNFIEIDMGQYGKSTIAYHLENKGKLLDAQYADGSRQKFNKVEQK